ncbi:hypothetical protein RT717_15620 [Imperialibacter roseus]|uniref:Lipoprotein n=1 Tax=Imperialibacter roseus TaxID=1324217 RepID=A0ABZ0IJ12_9BACT|nr:hypothetical protein [Imperialibacter roseus]WOK04509.1 hypothetical protein RT717_15620 [Imperialibacter roseus]
MEATPRPACRAFFAALFLTVHACTPELEADQPPMPDDYKDVSLRSEAYMTAMPELVGQVVDAAVKWAVDGPKQEEPWLKGAMVAHDKKHQIISVDFGNGGAWAGDVWRSGLLLITYTDLRLVDEATYRISFVNFKIDHVLVEGDFSFTYRSKGALTERKYEVRWGQGRFTWPDGTYATRQLNQIRTIRLAHLPMHNEYSWEGVASGVNRHGYEYSSIVTEKLSFRRTCLVVGKVFPSYGKVESTMKGVSFIVDYGEGECDNDVRSTINGEISTMRVSSNF